MPRTEAAYQQIRDERRGQILDAAGEVFVLKGFADTRISDLAEAAGMSQGLLYRYFADKDAVFTALVGRAARETIRFACSALEAFQTPWEQLYWLTEQILQGLLEQPVYYRLTAQAFAVPGAGKEITREFSELRNTVREIVIKGQAGGEIIAGDPDQLTLTYLCTLHGLAAGMMLFGEDLQAHFPDAGAVLRCLLV